MKKIILAVLAIAGMNFTSIALADDHVWYASIAFGQASGNDSQTTLDQATAGAGGSGFSSSYSKPTAYMARAGYEFNKNFSLEGSYLGSDKETYTASGGNLIGTATTSASFRGWALDAIGSVPLGSNFSVFGKIGLASVQQSTDPETVNYISATAVNTFSGYKTDVTYGLGARYDFNDTIFTRLDLDNYNIGNSTYANRVTIWSWDLGLKF